MIRIPAITFSVRTLVRALLNLLCVCVAGCSQQMPGWSSDDPAEHHVVAVNERGRSVRPSAWPQPQPTTQEYEHQLDGMMNAMDSWWDRYHRNHPDATEKRVLIFVHGGLTPPESSLVRSAAQTPVIEDNGYFPIFIIWNPELWSSWGEHVNHIRRGRYVDDGYWIGPFYFLADFGRAFTRFPVVWSYQIGNDTQRMSAGISGVYHSSVNRRWLDNPQFDNAIVVTDTLTKEYASTQPAVHDIAIPISLGKVQGKALDPLGHNALFWVMALPRLLLTPFLDAGGVPAWDNMYRRANILFDGFTTGNLRDKREGAETFVHPGPGAVIRLIEKLHEKQREENWQVTLVGHSMGSIVLNEFVRSSDQLDGDNPRRLKFANIVYMAAACSVRDFQRTIVPYLQRNEDTQFYNLSLHPVNEQREDSAAELAPRGSLLVWIDDMFSTPRTPLDRTLGRWENIVETVYVVPNEIRPRVHLKGFPAYVNIPNPPGNPQVHGDFSEMRYWDADFWAPSTPGQALKDIVDVSIKATAIREQREQAAPSTQQAR